MQWVGDAQIQIGPHDAPPPQQLAAFLTGFVDGVATHAAVHEAELLDVDEFGAVLRNPTRHVRFRFSAASRASAERLASDELVAAGVRSGMEAVDPADRELGWMISVAVEPD